jgi:hypothetical protein
MTNRPPLALVPPRPPFAPGPCPNWCDSEHAEREFGLLCHSAFVATSEDGHLVVWLQAVEDADGPEPAALGIAPSRHDLDGLTPEQMDDYAATLHRAAMRARAILDGAEQ